MSRRYKHYPSEVSCNYCHNPHNATQPALLLAEASSLCWQCHRSLAKVVDAAKVKHGGVTQGKKCSNCHNPHASNIEKMLIRLPFDLCVNCHGKDGMTSWDGKPMTNYRTWLAENKEWHAPVTAKDCSACHRTHGGDMFRLLVAEYPATFYASYDRKHYALCYGCHNERVVSEEETTTLTGFRNGS
jgi:predicted CXXCH cytochrome family protein